MANTKDWYYITIFFISKSTIDKLLQFHELPSGSSFLSGDDSSIGGTGPFSILSGKTNVSC